MKVIELAKTFNMSVSELVAISGYTRQSLYNILSGRNVNKGRFNAFLDLLQTISEHQYNEDIAQARINKNMRNKAITELKGVDNE